MELFWFTHKKQQIVSIIFEISGCLTTVESEVYNAMKLKFLTQPTYSYPLSTHSSGKGEVKDDMEICLRSAIKIVLKLIVV